MTAVDRLVPDAAVAAATSRPVVNRRKSPIFPPGQSDEVVVGR
ncbi:hypothetical protein R75465_05484 [Paraburkholderia aspalathi]|nr:hypothetical protein R75465_05484 [Paraburkholderia aspalathi]